MSSTLRPAKIENIRLSLQSTAILSKQYEDLRIRPKMCPLYIYATFQNLIAYRETL